MESRVLVGSCPVIAPTFESEFEAGFGVQSLGFKVLGLYGLGFEVKALGCRFEI